MKGGVMNILKKMALGMAVIALPTFSFAMTSISFFGGNNYVIGNKSAWSLEFLYAGAWKYGDNLFFFDATNPHRSVTKISGEWSTRFSFSKITGKSVKFGALSDVLVAAEMNLTGEDMRQYGLGIGTDWSVPHFSNLAANAYWVHNDRFKGQTYQLAAIWTMPIHVSDRIHLVFGGLMDYYGPMKGQLKDLNANFLAEPSLMLDLGHTLNISNNKLFAGIQYAYWHNMLGTTLEQSVPEAKITWVL
jgi:nucleoside-specific outer membrane channel protein Tsx